MINVLFLLSGNLGSVIYKSNFVQCFYNHFQSVVSVDIVTSLSPNDNNAIFETNSSVSNVLSINPFLRNDQGKLFWNLKHKDELAYFGLDYLNCYNVIIKLDMLPLVIKCDSLVMNNTYELYKIMHKWEEFYKVSGQEKYLKNPEDSMLDLYMHFVNKKVNVLNYLDINNDFDIDDSSYATTIGVKQEISNDDFCTKNNLKEKSFITVHYSGKISDYDSNYTLVWQKESFDELCRLLKNKFANKKIVQFGLGIEQSDFLKNADFNTTDIKNLKDLKKILSNSWLHIDVDSSYVHLNKAMGNKTVVLYGPTIPDFYGYKDDIKVVSNFCSSWCQGMVNDWNIKCLKGYIVPKCMGTITPNMVFDRIVNEIEIKNSNKKIKKNNKIVCGNDAEYIFSKTSNDNQILKIEKELNITIPQECNIRKFLSDKIILNWTMEKISISTLMSNLKIKVELKEQFGNEFFKSQKYRFVNFQSYLNDCDESFEFKEIKDDSFSKLIIVDQDFSLIEGFSKAKSIFNTLSNEVDFNQESKISLIMLYIIYY